VRSTRPSRVFQTPDSECHSGASLCSPCCAAALPDPFRFAILLRSRTCHYFPVMALATVLLAHSPAFGRSDEILYLVEKASDLTLPDSVRCHFTCGKFNSIPAPRAQPPCHRCGTPFRASPSLRGVRHPMPNQPSWRQRCRAALRRPTLLVPL
jgi:hypothetical protein